MSLYLTDVSITVTENMEREKSVHKELECVELGDLQQKDERRAKAPRRVIHFSSGETMEEYSTEDEEDHIHTQPDKNNLLSSVDTSEMTWGPYVWFQMWRAATNTVSACDYVGERMASLFGITSAKYQYAIDEHNRTSKQTEDEARGSSVSEEAESCFDEKQTKEIQEQNLNKAKLEAEAPLEAENPDAEAPAEVEKLDAEAPPEAENLDAEAPAEAENLEAEAPAEAEKLDAEAPPEAKKLDAEAPPEAEKLDAEAPAEAENLEAEAPAEAENLDAEAPAEVEKLDAEAPPEAENLDAEASPEAENLDAEAPAEVEKLDAEASPEAENLDAEASPEAENLDAEAPAENP